MGTKGNPNSWLDSGTPRQAFLRNFLFYFFGVLALPFLDLRAYMGHEVPAAPLIAAGAFMGILAGALGARNARARQRAKPENSQIGT